jgi:hypothetical protein
MKLLFVIFMALAMLGAYLIGAGISTQARIQPADIDEWLIKNSHLFKNHHPHHHHDLMWSEDKRKTGI